MVHRRTSNDTDLVFGNQGALWGNAMTWWDTETGSVWSQPIGEAILGPKTGERLELLPSSLGTWADWKAVHPETLALDVPSGADGFDLEEMAIVVEFGRSSLAVPVSMLRTEPVANVEVDGVPVAVVLQPDTDRWTVFSRRLDDEIIELALDGDALVEAGAPSGSGRRFAVDSGLALDADESLDQLPGFTSFPADYTTFFPDGAFWTTSGVVDVDDRAE